MDWNFLRHPVVAVPLVVGFLALIALAEHSVENAGNDGGSSPVASSSAESEELDLDERVAEAPQPKKQKKRNCNVEGAETIAKSAQIWVFRLPESFDSDGFVSNDHVACNRKTGEWQDFLKGDYETEIRVREANGYFFIALGSYGCPDVCDGEPLDFALYDVASGEQHDLEDGLSDEDPFTIFETVLLSNGTVFYAVERGVEGYANDQPKGRQIVKYEAATKTFTSLDSGPGIDLSSFDRSGESITWTNNGAARSATL